jgi:hypothetical protein
VLSAQLQAGTTPEQSPPQAEAPQKQLTSALYWLSAEVRAPVLQSETQEASPGSQASMQFQMSPQPLVQAFQASPQVPLASVASVKQLSHAASLPPVVLPVLLPVVLPVVAPVVLPVVAPVVLPVVAPVVLPVVAPVVLPVVLPVLPVVVPHSVAHSVGQPVLQMQSPTALYSVTAVLPAVVAQVSSQVLSVQAPRQLASVTQALSLPQALYAASQAPPLSVALVWQVSQLLPVVVLPVVEPVPPPVVEPVAPVVEPPPHSLAHWVAHDVQMQVLMALRVSTLAWGAALTHASWQAVSPAAQAPMQVLSVTQSGSPLHA